MPRAFRNLVIPAGETLLECTLELEQLTIEEGARILPPDGKYVTLIVNQVVKALLPGLYKGRITLAVTDFYMEKQYSSGARWTDIPLEAALVLEDGKVAATVPGAVTGGRITGSTVDGIYVGAEKGAFAGVVVSGSGEYTIRNSHFDLEDLDGRQNDDFVGKGAGIVVPDNAKVTVENCDFRMTSIGRCAVHVGGRSDVTVNNSRMFNYSTDCEMADFSWGISACGTNRLNQLTDDGVVHYNHCYFASNGWGSLSVDGNNRVSMYVKDSYLELSGPRSYGYGAFCIGDSHFYFDHSKFNVNGFPLMTMGNNRAATLDVYNGCEITGRRYGLHMLTDVGTKVSCKDSAFRTASSNIVAKSANADISLDNMTMEAGNGIILQMMDSDDPGHAFFIDVSMYEHDDTYIEGRELSKVDPEKDLCLTISNSDLTGDFFNSTTNLKKDAKKENPAGIPRHDPDLMPPGGLSPFFDLSETDGVRVPRRGTPPEAKEKPMMPRFNLPLPQNLGITLTDCTLSGAISSAKQIYAPQFDYIDDMFRSELGNITQTPAPTVNNGVCVTLSGKTVWTVTKTSYITALTLGEDAEITAPPGKALRITADGKPVVLAPGSYTGKIILEVL